MIKKKLIFIALVTLTLALLLSGCSGESGELDGKNIVTFEMNGGTLNYGTSSTNTKVNYAYHPGTYILDPTTISTYSISRNGYIFTGWYTSEECKPNEKWDFTRTFDTEKLVLFAGWEKAIKYSYTVYYMDGDEAVSLGKYDGVEPGEKFEDWRGFADGRDGYTGIGFYSDAECLVEWDFDYKHPGGDADCDIPVYVKYIEGEWELVDSYDELKSALSDGNVYLTADIDCGGKELPMRDFDERIFEGNGFTVSNFTVKKSTSLVKPAVAMFKSLGKGAVVRNVSFVDVTFDFSDIREGSGTVAVKPNVASLAVSMSAGATVSDVSVSGKIVTNFSGDFPCLNEVYYYAEAADSAVMAGVTDFIADITVEKQS